ncbi:MAG: murein hydrolase activator EnvC family protein [Bacteroidota bacterium]
MRRTFVFFTIAGILLLAVRSAPAVAVETAGVDQMIEKTRSALAQKKKQEQQALTILTKNQRELNRIQANLHTINRQLLTAQQRAAYVREELKRTERDLLLLEERLGQRSDLLRRRVNVFYRYGPMSFLELLLTARNLQDLMNRYELSSYFIRQDLKLIEEYRRTHRAVELKRRQIQEQHDELSARTRAISALQSKAAAQQKQMAAKIRYTQEEVARIQADRQRLEEALEEYERISKELGSEMRRKSSGSVLGTGKMMWPVLGRLSSSYGWRRHPVLKKKKFHNGQDIAVATGTPVLAADSGVVQIAGWKGGYGWFVAIDHGRNLSTCYGHNSVLLVKEGDVVVKGQRIALSGSTGLSTGPHLHFEVRINGEPVNPIPYLPK